MRRVSIHDFLSDEQIARCEALYPDVSAIYQEVIAPAMADVDSRLGQENDATFLAYAVCYVIECERLAWN